MTLDVFQQQQCDETRLLQCYGFHSEANEMAIADIKAIAGKSRR